MLGNANTFGLAPSSASDNKWLEGKEPEPEPVRDAIGRSPARDIGTEVVGRPHSVVHLLGPNKDSQYRAALHLQRMPRLFERAARLAAAGSPECGEKKLGSRKLDGWKHGRKEDMKMIAGP